MRAKAENSIVGNLNTQLSITDRAPRQKSHKDIRDLDIEHAVRLLDIIDHDPPAAKYTIFSNAHRTLSRTDCTLGHKTNFSTFKMIEIMQNIFSDHNGIKLEIKNRRKFGNTNFTNTWKLSNTFLTNL